MSSDFITAFHTTVVRPQSGDPGGQRIGGARVAQVRTSSSMITNGFIQNFDEYFVTTPRPRWRVERSDTVSIPFALSGRGVESRVKTIQQWWAYPDDDGTDDLVYSFPTWREAFDYATRMAHQ